MKIDELQPDSDEEREVLVAVEHAGEGAVLRLGLLTLEVGRPLHAMHAGRSWIGPVRLRAVAVVLPLEKSFLFELQEKVRTLVTLLEPVVIVGVGVVD